jgi:tryptophan synthase beta chain
VAAGLDYTGIGPEHAYLKSMGRVDYQPVTDARVIEALKTLITTEGIIPALESSHAVAKGIEIAKKAKKDQIIVINVSGRGDKDIFIIAEALKDREWFEFLEMKVREGLVDEK